MSLTYGSYEITGELYQTPTGAVLQARLIGTSDPANLAIKTCRSRSDEAGAELAAMVFRRRAEVQSALKEGWYWAPIHDIRSTDDEVYCITDYYPRSAQSLIDTRVRLSSDELRAIIEAVCGGLNELKDEVHRAHGALKPTNVLIRKDSSPITPSSAVLSDPAADDPPADGAGEAADLRVELRRHLGDESPDAVANRADGVGRRRALRDPEGQ